MSKDRLHYFPGRPLPPLGPPLGFVGLSTFRPPWPFKTVGKLGCFGCFLVCLVVGWFIVFSAKMLFMQHQQLTSSIYFRLIFVKRLL